MKHVHIQAVVVGAILAGLASGTWAKDDKDLIASATSAAPPAVAKHATVMAVDEKGETRIVRKGTNNFTCLPDDPKTPANDPMCLDENGLQWASAWMNKTEPPKGKIGFAYMLQGGGTPSNVDPFASPSKDGQLLKEPSHVMVLGHGGAMQGYPDPGKNPDTSQPWVMWSGTPYEHLMIPVK